MPTPDRAPVTSEHRKHASSVLKGLPFFCDDRELELLAQAIADAEARGKRPQLALLRRCQQKLASWYISDKQHSTERHALLTDIRAELERK
jgi:hypothetical protein